MLIRIYLLLLLLLSSQLFSQEKLDFTIRLGQGGFSDNRSPIGQLGGGQLAFDFKPKNIPLALSISGEYYTNSAGPTHSYEIQDATIINILYMKKVLKSERAILFAGGGMGWLEVPKDESESEETTKGIVYNIEAGINYIAFWKIGFYGIYKYLYSKKKVNDAKVIDFSEHIVLLGLTFNFSI
jgi:hypothetical protein